MSYDEELKKHRGILESKEYQTLENYVAHGKTSTKEHSISVVKCGLKIIDKLHLKVKRDEFIRSALLHDLFLYDWHHAPKEAGLHGYTHSKTAAENAKRLYGVNDREYANIVSHMWPLNITKFPKTIEGVILCIADKICSLKETINRK